MAEKKKLVLAEPLVLTKLKIQAFSIFIGYHYLHHGNRIKHSSHCLWYHTNDIHASYNFKVALAMMYGATNALYESPAAD